MKHLKLNNTAYRYLIELYAEWLQTLGYATKTVRNLPTLLQEFLHFLENNHIYDLNKMEAQHINNYYHYIQQRSNSRRSGALANATINNQRRMLFSFTNYLRQSGRMIIPALDIHCLDARKEKLNTLTEPEIKLLFKATYTIDELQHPGRTPLGERDRAMLCVYYGCGLRRSEALNLKLEDINTEKQLLHITKAKGYKERLVPIHSQYLQHIEQYLYNTRYLLLDGTSSQWLFISQRAQRINEHSIYLRLQTLAKHTANQNLIDKKPSLHTLRHSIATHLLHKGLPLEYIAKFLGHSTLESTQIYTHIQLPENE